MNRADAQVFYQIGYELNYTIRTGPGLEVKGLLR